MMILYNLHMLADDYVSSLGRVTHLLLLVLEFPIILGAWHVQPVENAHARALV